MEGKVGWKGEKDEISREEIWEIDIEVAEWVAKV